MGTKHTTCRDVYYSAQFLRVTLVQISTATHFTPNIGRSIESSYKQTHTHKQTHLYTPTLPWCLLSLSARMPKKQHFKRCLYALDAGSLGSDAVVWSSLRIQLQASRTWAPTDEHDGLNTQVVPTTVSHTTPCSIRTLQNAYTHVRASFARERSGCIYLSFIWMLRKRGQNEASPTVPVEEYRSTSMYVLAGFCENC